MKVKIMSKDIWFISDYHLFHDNILKFNNPANGHLIRPFKTIWEMHEHIIEKHNSIVKPDDIVYNLGDVFFGNYHKNKENIIEILKQLNGKHNLIIGNHDNVKNIIDLKFFNEILFWKKFYSNNLIASHVPLRDETFNEKYINIHGHTHELGSPLGRFKSVCVEIINYLPKNIEELMEKN